MNLTVERYVEQMARWPRAGRYILAQFDATSIVVYQAYKSAIGRYAAEQGRFGGREFGYSRMSWIKPNFLWMMYRCGWAANAAVSAGPVSPAPLPSVIVSYLLLKPDRLGVADTLSPAPLPRVIVSFEAP